MTGGSNRPSLYDEGERRGEGVSRGEEEAVDEESFGSEKENECVFGVLEV